MSSRNGHNGAVPTTGSRATPARASPQAAGHLTIRIFCHSIRSDWNHGNAHFLRGVGSELVGRGHDVLFCEPRNGWSYRNLVARHGRQPVDRFRRRYPELRAATYEPDEPRLEPLVDGADLVLVHEWTDPGVVGRLGVLRDGADFRLLFHDTHHRAVTDPAWVEALDLSSYDGVLAFGASLRDVYLERGWADRVWVWHEAADVQRFAPPEDPPPSRGDVVWIGNWGDDERTETLRRFFLRPVERLDLRARVHGVRYPDEGLAELRRGGVEYGGWVENDRVPEMFARFRSTVHLPRRPYVEELPGIPTIRVFEALACGAPMVSAHWEDVEGLFSPGEDYLVARTEDEAVEHLRMLTEDPDTAAEIGSHGRATVEARHTCAHRVDELLAIEGELRP